MFKGEPYTNVPNLFAHAFSVALDDLVQVEVAEIRTGYHEYAKVIVRGAGIGNILKAGLFAKNMWINKYIKQEKTLHLHS